MSFVKLLNVNAWTLQGSCAKSQTLGLTVQGKPGEPCSSGGISNAPASTAIVMHSSVDLQVQHLQEQLQLQSTTWSKTWKSVES